MSQWEERTILTFKTQGLCYEFSNPEHIENGAEYLKSYSNAEMDVIFWYLETCPLCLKLLMFKFSMGFLASIFSYMKTYACDQNILKIPSNSDNSMKSIKTQERSSISVSLHTNHDPVPILEVEWGMGQPIDFSRLARAMCRFPT